MIIDFPEMNKNTCTATLYNKITSAILCKIYPITSAGNIECSKNLN